MQREPLLKAAAIGFLLTVSTLIATGGAKLGKAVLRYPLDDTAATLTLDVDIAFFQLSQQNFQITNKLAAILAVAMLLGGSAGIVMLLYRFYDLVRDAR
ncbi:MAG: hypothetical protein AAF171_17665 [Cyanobacteria bacterium P01_A01_bin.116]